MSGLIVDYGTRDRKSYVGSLLKLVGHLGGTAFVFGMFILFGWVISFGLHFLHGIHPFPAEVLEVLTGFELGLVYFDGLLCTVVFAAGAVRFWKDLTR